MTRRLYYKKLESIFFNFMSVSDLFQANPREFNELLSEELGNIKEDLGKKESQRVKKDLINRFFLEVGIKKTLKMLQKILVMVDDCPPTNNLLVAIVQEMICEVEKYYKMDILRKIPRLYSGYLDLDLEEYLAREDVVFVLGLDFNTSFQEFSFWEMTDSFLIDDINTAAGRNLKMQNFIFKNIIVVNGWESFNDFAYHFINDITFHNMTKEIDENFVRLFMSICEEFMERVNVEKSINKNRGYGQLVLFKC